MSGIIWLASYPKSGNTWIRAFLANYLMANECRPVGINSLNILNFYDRAWWDCLLGWKTADLTEEAVFRLRLSAQEATAKLGVTFFKTHEAFFDPASGEPLISVESTFRVIYIIRNPLDVAISYANHMGQTVDVAIDQMNCPNTTIAKGKKGPANQLPQRMGDWSWHVQSWVERSGIPVQVVRYEDMLADPKQTFAKICKFTELAWNEVRFKFALESSNFEALRSQEESMGFRERPAQCPKFFSKGRSGQWREGLSRSQIDAILNSHKATMDKFNYSADEVGDGHRMATQKVRVTAV